MYTAVEVPPRRYLQEILHIVECIYAAACGEMPWEQTVAEVCRVGKLDGCALCMIDRLERRRVVLASCGLISAADSTLGAMPGDPKSTDRVLRSTPGTVWQDRQIMSDGLSTRLFWADWMQSQGCVSWGWVVVGGDERGVVCLEAYAGAKRGSSCPELDDFLNQIAPHLSRAWRLGRASRSSCPTAPCAAPPSYSHTDAAPAPDLAGLPGVVRLRAEFGLTKAEARLALRLAEGSSLASAAQAFNVKLTTIRSQLQQVFAKTGTSRQTELVAMLLSGGHGARGPLWSPPKRERQSAALEEAGS
jgi:DNA-binding CsgD family transcriptional regulator